MLENEYLNKPSFKTRVASFAHQVLPEPIQYALRVVLGKQSIILKPFQAEILGYSAYFWVKNPSDRNVIVNSNYEQEFSQQLITKVAETKGVFADIGSAQGYYSLIGAKAGAKVFAFDPDPMSKASFCQNLALNPDLTNCVYLIAEALGDREGEVELNADYHGRYAPSLRKTQSNLTKRVAVSMSRFDFLVDQGRVVVPQVVKIDVEGAEGLVIAGMQETLGLVNRPRDLFIELHPEYLPLFGTDPSLVVNNLFKLGYVFATDPCHRGGQIQCHFTDSNFLK